MASKEHLRILEHGWVAWRDWREEHQGVTPDFTEANLTDANLTEADLSRADLAGINLFEANLTRANLAKADLTGANLYGANLTGANLTEADLTRADLTLADLTSTGFIGANLTLANLTRANLKDADFRSSHLRETSFSVVDLSSCKSLESCNHYGPSIVDIRTLQRSGPLPLSFLRGIGLPDAFIDYLPSLLGRSIQLYSCFISYSAKDEDFARRLHADLQDKDVRCWFAPEDMKIGAKILDTIDEAIRLRDKVLLVLSERSITSEWVEDEVTKAFAEERRRGGVVLFPIRLDDAVFETKEAWALKLRDNRNIGDFRGWKKHDAYHKALDRLLRDLRIEAT
jgi:TIR domain/Pentapeptide repeats (8 copies)